MGKSIDLSDYVEVRERVRVFYERFPSGSIRTEMVVLEDEMVVFKAVAFRDPQDPRPTTGWAYERPGTSEINRRYLVENCETSAVGRALANLDIAATRRPSREEMSKVVRRRGEDAAAAPRPSGDPEPAARIRSLLGRLGLSTQKRTRILEKLEAGITPQEARDLEAYLLALLPARG